jgi:hypothetical protein
MASVDPIFAQWLQEEGLWASAEDLAGEAIWGTAAGTVERMSSIAFLGDAIAEAERQLAFLKGPLVIDEHLLSGEWRSYRGQVITLTGPRLGYDAGINVFVLGAEDNLATGLSTVTVLRRLAA